MLPQSVDLKGGNANMFHFADRLPPCECRPQRHNVCMFFLSFFLERVFNNMWHPKHVCV